MNGLVATLAVLSFLLAGPSEVPEPSGYWTGPAKGDVPATITGGKVIHAKALAAMIEENSVIIIDVDNAPKKPPQMAPGAPWLPLPHEAIPGSIWLPGVGMGVVSDSTARYFRDRLAALTAGDKSRAIVIYCHEKCWLSWNAARRAIEHGYTNVYWFPEGIEGWRAAGYPTEIVEPEAVPE